MDMILDTGLPDRQSRLRVGRPTLSARSDSLLAMRRNTDMRRTHSLPPSSETEKISTESDDSDTDLSDCAGRFIICIVNKTI